MERQEGRKLTRLFLKITIRSVPDHIDDEQVKENKGQTGGKRKDSPIPEGQPERQGMAGLKKGP